MRVVNRRFLLRKRVLIPVGSGAALLLLAWFVLLPWVVRGRVEAVLHQLNLRDVTFRVTRATPWSSTVRDIDAGDGNHIDALRVTYSIEGLWNRRVDAVRVMGLQVTADVGDGGVRIAPLDAMLGAAPAASRPAAAGDAVTPAGADDWPFRSVRVEDSTVVVRTPDRTITLPFQATLRRPELHAELGKLIIDGPIGDPDATNLRVSGEGLAGEELTAVLRTLVPQAQVRIAGLLRIDGSLAQTAERTTFNAQLVTGIPSADESAEAATKETDTKIAGTNVVVEEGVFHIAGSVSNAGLAVDVTAEDVTVAETSVGAKATGVKAWLLFGNLSSASTPPTQIVRFETLSASKLDLTDGFMQFSFAPDGTVNVQVVRAQLLGGIVSAEDVRVVAGEPTPVMLAVADVELRELLELLAQGKATGEGKVNGRLPLIVGGEGLRFGNGAAEASAGGGLRITDDSALDAIAGGVVAGAKSTAASSPQAQVRQDIVAALKDFRYQSLTAQLKHEPDKGLVAYVRMTGKGRTGARQELDYDLRVTGLDDLLRSVIGIHRTVTREATRQ